MARTTEKHGKWNTNTVRPGICPKETDKVRKGETHMVVRGIWQKILKNVQNEKQILYILQYC